jgi:hypothetical protein
MASGYIPRYTDEKPRFKNDIIAYDRNCTIHEDCKATKAIRESICKYCGTNLDKAGTRFYDIGKNKDHMYVHADCHERHTHEYYV